MEGKEIINITRTTNLLTKKLPFFIIAECLFFTVMSLNAQTAYQPFRVDLGLGLDYTLVDRGVGLGLIIEPKYAVIPDLNVGIKFEGNLIEGSKEYSINHLTSSCLATADYYFMQNIDVRTFFVGGGLGIYHVDAYSDLGPMPNIRTTGITNNFGAMLRVGIDASHFRIALAYNFAGKDVAGYDSSFFSLTIGGYFGGGKKKISNL